MITYEEKEWLEELTSICQEHMDYYLNSDDEETQGVGNLCNALIFSYNHLNFKEVQRPTIH